MIKFIQYRWKWLVAVGVLGLVILLAFRPVMSRVKVWRAAGLVEESQEHAAAGEWVEALRTSLAAVQLDPKFEGLRAYFVAQRQTGDSGVLRTAAVIATHPEASDEDRALALSTFLDTRDLVNGGNLIGAFSEETRESTVVRFQIVRFLLASNQLEQAVALADSVSDGERTASFDLLLCRELLRDSRPVVREEAFKRMALLLANDDREVALDAARILASQPDDRINRELAQKALDRFRGDSDLGVAERFGFQLFELGLQPERREEIIANAIRDHRETDLERLLQWLLRIGEAEKVAELSDGIEKPSLEIFRYRSRALRLLERYDELLAELEQPPAGVSTVEAFSARAAISHLLGKKVEESGYWRQALSYAKLRPNQNLYPQIAGIAGQVGVIDIQMEAIARSIEHPLGVPPLASQLGPLFAWLAKQDSERLLSVSRKLLQREPGNPMLVNNYYYLLTLTQKPNEDAISTLGKLVEAFPKAISFRGSLAFAHVRLGEPEKALEVLDAVEMEPEDFPDGEKAVYAAALAGAGKKDDATAMAEQVEWDALSERERKVFRELME